MSIQRQIRIWNNEQTDWLDDMKISNPKLYNKFVSDSAKKRHFDLAQKDINRLTNNNIKGQRQRRLREAIEKDARQAIVDRYIRKYKTIIDSFFTAGLIDKKKAGPYKLMRNIRSPKNVNRQLLRDQIYPGMWYIFLYDPKTKKELEYYDRVPLVYVLRTFENGFLGLNFHHMHPRFRRRWLQFAEQFKKGHGLHKYIDLNWSIINSLDKYKMAKPTIRRYNYSHMRSRAIKIPEHDWELMTIIPSLRHFGLQAQAVWQKNVREALKK